MAKWFEGCKDEKEAKKLYRKLCMKLHPDHGGNEAEFKEMKAQYDNFSTQKSNQTFNSQGGQWYGSSANNNYSYRETYSYTDPRFSGNSGFSTFQQAYERAQQWRKQHEEYERQRQKERKARFDSFDVQEVIALNEKLKAEKQLLEMEIYRHKLTTDILKTKISDQQGVIESLQKELNKAKKNLNSTDTQNSTLIEEQNQIIKHLKQQIESLYSSQPKTIWQFIKSKFKQSYQPTTKEPHA